MSKKRISLLLIISSIALVASVVIVQNTLQHYKIPFGNSCAITSYFEGDDAPRRVCNNGTCMLYSDWIETAEGQKALAEKTN